MGVLPILHTGLRENHVKLDNYIIPIQTKYQQHLEENKADIEKCEQIINDINSKIDEYNLLTSKLIEYGIEDFQPATHVELID
jgi:ferritin-like metal-binding protein YciE